MTTTLDPQSEDYVLVPKRRAKLTRARKFTVIAMVVGAAVSVAGAGTFASFSASTTNDATFSTDTLIMSNNDGTNTCFSAGDGAGAGQGTIDNSGVTNDGSCAVLFTASENQTGTTYTKTITITNKGTSAHDIYLWRTGTCASTDRVNALLASGNGDICANLRMTIERTTANGQTLACLFPTNAGACLNPDTPANTTTAVTNWTANTSFTNKLQATSSTVAANSTAVFTVKFRLPNAATCGLGSYTQLADGSTQLGTEGQYTAAGVNCNNVYINKKATMGLKWYMSV
jgi:hypothetical protein